MTGVAAGISQQIVLVLGFRLPELAGGNDFGDCLARPQTGSIDVGNRVFGDAFLLIARVEDRRAIAGADVVALAVARARVVDLEEEFEQLPVADARRVEEDLDRLGVPRVIAISRVGVAAAGVSDPRRQNAVLAANEVLRAPEAAAGEDRAFLIHGCPLPGPDRKHTPRPPSRRGERSAAPRN